MTVQLIGFKVGKENYALNILSIVQIIKHREVTPIPRAPEFIEGILELRGEMIPIIDLRKRFSTHKEDPEQDSRIIVADPESSQSSLGLVVDEVKQVLKVDEEDLRPAPDILEQSEAEYVNRVARIEEELFLIVDLEKLLSPVERRELRDSELAENSK